MTTEYSVPGAVKTNVQAIGVQPTNYLEQKIGLMVKKLKAHSSFVDAVDVYLKTEGHHVDSPRTVQVRCFIPGEDIAASDTGQRWKLILKNVEKKLLRQLEKKKGQFRHMEK